MLPGIGHAKSGILAACMVLTDAGVRAAKPRERDYKLTDSGGLVLFVSKAGAGPHLQQMR